MAPMDLTFIQQDPDSEAGSIETAMTKVRDSYVSLNKKACLLCILWWLMSSLSAISVWK